LGWTGLNETLGWREGLDMASTACRDGRIAAALPVRCRNADLCRGHCAGEAQHRETVGGAGAKTIHPAHGKPFPAEVLMAAVASM
jgi:hypothetical protein